MQLLLYWLVKHFQVFYYLHHAELKGKELGSEQKRLQNGKKHKIKQLWNVQYKIMHMGFSSVFNNTQLSFFSFRPCSYKKWAVCRFTQVGTHKRRFITHLIKKEKENLHINNLQFEQPYSSILRQNPPRLYAVG